MLEAYNKTVKECNEEIIALKEKWGYDNVHTADMEVEMSIKDLIILHHGLPTPNLHNAIEHHIHNEDYLAAEIATKMLIFKQEYVNEIEILGIKCKKSKK